MEESRDKRRGQKWVIPFAAVVTVLHLGAVSSWYLIGKMNPEISYDEKVEMFNAFWVIPEIISSFLFNGVLLILSIIVVTLAGKMVEESKNQLGIVLLVINLCLVLISGWSIL
ncbi:MAG: hypothetical protein MK086_02735 [Flavobacteriales bacterium]|nr:hypothetical protein [Flavobacteriales bacterium]